MTLLKKGIILAVIAATMAAITMPALAHGGHCGGRRATGTTSTTAVCAYGNEACVQNGACMTDVCPGYGQGGCCGA